MSNTIVSPKHTVTADDIKANVPQVVAMIKKLLKVGCKPSHALDIAAAAVGIKDYATIKGLADKDFYHAKANIGGYGEQEFIIERDLGFFNNPWDARESFTPELEKINIDATWEICCNGEEIGHRVYSTPEEKGAKGYTLTVTATGEDEQDLIQGLECVIRDIHCKTGFDDARSRSYKFVKYGEELTPNIFNSYDYAIIDDNGFIEREVDDLTPIFIEAGQGDEVDIQSWEGDLVLLEAIDPEESTVNYDESCIALDADGKVVHEMDYDSMIETLKESEEQLHLYRELKRKR